MTDNPARRRTSGRARRTFDTSVPSPCISVCTLDQNNICTGCFRDVDEIREWMIMPRERKLQVLAQVELRKRKAATGRVRETDRPTP